jgi:hypothetical protein
MEVVDGTETFFVAIGLWPTQGDEKRLSPTTTLHGATALSFVIPSVAEGSAVQGTSPGNANSYSQTKLSSRPERSVVERSAVFFRLPHICKLLINQLADGMQEELMPFLDARRRFSSD